MREALEDPNLADVKAVLRKLQRLDVSGEAQPFPDRISPRPPRSVPPEGSGKQLLGIFKRKREAFFIRSVRPWLSRRSVIIAGAALTLIACASVLIGPRNSPNNSAGIEREKHSPMLDKKPEEHSPALDKKNEVILLTEARRLIGDGDVKSARKRLMQGGPKLERTSHSCLRRLLIPTTFARSQRPTAFLNVHRRRPGTENGTK